MVMLPFVFLLLKGAFFWNKRCNKYLNLILSKIYFNVYLRFVLEAYLELSLSSILRFKNFTFGSSSEVFHSIFALVLFTGLVAFLLFSLVFLQVKFPVLATKEANQRYGDLYLGLKTRERWTVM